MTLPNTVIICHGESEHILAKTLSSRLRVPVECYCRNNGHETIALSSLPGLLSAPPFDSIQSLHKAFPKLDYRRVNRQSMMPNLKIVPIMDVDGDILSKNAYITGDLFRGCPLRDHIIPILNDSNLEVVIEGIGYPKVTDKVSYYSNMVLEPLEFYRKLRSCDNTNMDQFVELLMRSSSAYQGMFNR